MIPQKKINRDDNGATTIELSDKRDSGQSIGSMGQVSNKDLKVLECDTERI